MEWGIIFFQTEISKDKKPQISYNNPVPLRLFLSGSGRTTAINGLS